MWRKRRLQTRPPLKRGDPPLILLPQPRILRSHPQQGSATPPQVTGTSQQQSAPPPQATDTSQQRRGPLPKITGTSQQQSVPPPQATGTSQQQSAPPPQATGTSQSVSILPPLSVEAEARPTTTCINESHEELAKKKRLHLICLYLGCIFNSVNLFFIKDDY